MRARMWSAACAVLIALACDAFAAPRIVLVETRGAPKLPTLAAQVEMHAVRGTSVQSIAEPALDPMTFAERARALAITDTIVVWIAPVEGGFLVFAAGRWPGRALIELVRIEASTAPADIERTIALKIAALLDALVAPRPLSVALDIDVPRRVPPWRIEIDAAFVREARDRKVDGRISFAVVRAWSRDGWSIAPVLGAYWQPSGTIDGELGHVSIHEVGGELAIEGARLFHAFDVFARGRLLAGALLVDGNSDDGRHGEPILFAPFVGAELGARGSLSSHVAVGVAAGYDFALIRHQLFIDEETIVDLGRGSLHVGLCLTMSL